jgi:hypothetical protein
MSREAERGRFRSASSAALEPWDAAARERELCAESWALE